MSATLESNHAASGAVLELCGRFATDAALQDAVGRLTEAGFDRSRLVVTATGSKSRDASVAESDNAKPEDDRRQLRTVHSSTAAAAGAMAGAAVVVATGGAALAAVAAAAGAGALAGGGMFAASNASDSLQSQERDEAAGRGQLYLIVSIADASLQPTVEAALRHAGATEVSAFMRENAAIGGQVRENP